MSIKSKADKHVIKQLQDYASSDLKKFILNKEVYYDAMDQVIEILRNAYEAKSGNGIEQLIENISEIKKTERGCWSSFKRCGTNN